MSGFYLPPQKPFHLTPQTPQLQPHWSHLPQLAAYHDWVGLTRSGIVPLSFSMRQEPLDNCLNRALGIFSQQTSTLQSTSFHTGHDLVDDTLRNAFAALDNNIDHDLLSNLRKGLNPVTTTGINVATGNAPTVGGVTTDGYLSLDTPDEMAPGTFIIGKTVKFSSSTDIQFGVIVDDDALQNRKYTLVVSAGRVVVDVIGHSGTTWKFTATLGRDQTGSTAGALSIICAPGLKGIFHHNRRH